MVECLPGVAKCLTRRRMCQLALRIVIAIAAGTQHGLALRKDSTVAGWGFNFDNVTVSPPGLSNVVAISAGAEHSLALKSDGTVIAWGRNQWGQTNVPLGLTNVIAISAGSYFNLALKKDGTVVEWGGNAPEGLSNVIAIAAGPWHALEALRLKNGSRSLRGEEKTFEPTKAFQTRPQQSSLRSAQALAITADIVWL